ncbi:serine hydrolase [Allosphingosinicella sp.]|jgi:beta-lactamase class A|uniref:serine hydrolase n=1 Tax=Allosphingosinicella sp. TaxID=2823234 RepID=UPI002EDD81AC
MNRTLLAFIASVGISLAFPVVAASQQPSPELSRRADALPALFRGEGLPAELFTPGFLEQVSADQVNAVFAQLRAQHGAAQGLNRFEARSATSGVAYVDFERAMLRFDLVVEPEPPHRISGLLLTGTELRGDSFARLGEEFAALPGQASLAVARLGETAPTVLASRGSDRPMAIGSAFKLFILAELDRSIRAGERRWGDVVPVDRLSAPGTMQYWPRRAPVTLHTLAALMISQSDNSATDILLHALGREKVERMLPNLGVRAPERNRPFLSTLEAFILKSAPDPLLRSWLDADEAQRRRILSSRLAEPSIGDVDESRFGTAPAQIEAIEWFASAEDLVRTMDWLRRNGSDETRAILAIATGVPRSLAGEFAYVGYKGGSEPGVINMTFLVRNRAGAWHSIAGTWNDPAAPVDNARFAALMQRAVQLVR